MIFSKKHFCLPYLLLVFFFFLFATPLFAAEYVTLAGLPSLEGYTTGNLVGYLNKIYIIIISLAAMFAVIKIAIAGTKYVLTDMVSSKESAKSNIRGALLGLLIILGTYVILNEINPNLTNLNVLGNAGGLEGVDVPNSVSTTVPEFINETGTIKRDQLSEDLVRSGSAYVLTPLCKVGETELNNNCTTLNGQDLEKEAYIEACDTTWKGEIIGRDTYRSTFETDVVDGEEREVARCEQYTPYRPPEYTSSGDMEGPNYDPGGP